MKQSKSNLERAFDTQFRILGEDLPKPESDYVFHPTRKWRLDRAWPDYKLAVEIEGGVYGRPVKCHNCGVQVRARKKDGSVGKVLRPSYGHASFGRYMGDKEKYNTLESMGWNLLRFSNEDILATPFEMVDLIREALHSRRYRVSMIEKITNREMDVLRLIAAGFKTPQIAKRLGVKPNAVRTYVGDLCQKLIVPNRASAVARACCWGILNLDEIPWPEEVLAIDLE